MRRGAWAFGVDVVCVFAFVALGRRTHDEGLTLASVLGVAAPFLIALVAGWAALRMWRAPVSATLAVNLWLVASLGGMALRRVVFQRSTAMVFVIVGTATLGLLLVGWRALVRRFAPQRAEA